MPADRCFIYSGRLCVLKMCISWCIKSHLLLCTVYTSICCIFYAYPIQTWILIYLVCLFPLLLFVFTVRFFPLLQGNPVDWSKDKSAQRIQREKVLVVFPVSRGAVPCSRCLCSVFWFRCVVRRQTGAGRRAYLCWYSNKEHDRPCVIPALPTHLSTMLRRPPPQIYAKQMDTAPFTHFPPISVSFTHCRTPTPSNPLQPTYLSAYP